MRRSKPKLLDSSTQFILFCLTLTFIKTAWLFFNGLPLYADEAQYWLWSKYLDFGYYSKPPVIAAIIKCSTYLLGDTEAAVRFLSPIIHCATAFAIFSLSKNLYSERVGYLASLTYITLPAVFFSSMLISTDVPLLLIWTLALDQLYKAIKSDSITNWVFLGTLFGIGMLTKYHFAIFGVAGLIFIYKEGKLRQTLHSYKPYVAAVIAFLIFLPNIIWNFNNHFASFSHTAELASSGQSIINIKSFIEFTLAQILMLGPILVIGLLSVAKISKKLNSQDSFLIIFASTFFAFIALISLISKAYANWAAPAYIPLIIFLCGILFKKGSMEILGANFVFQCAIGVIFLLYPLVFTYIGLPDVFKRLRGAEELAQEVVSLKQTLEEDVVVISDDRKTFASLVFYGKPYLYNLKKWNPEHNIRDHFDLKASIHELQAPAIFVSKYATESYLQQFTEASISEKSKPDSNTRIYLITSNE